MSGWLNYSAPYESILRHIKDKGIRVFHRTITGGVAGYYDGGKCIITIDKRFRGKVEGCFYLCHEFCHYNQYRYNEFPDFFKIDGALDEITLPLVIEAELDADKKASKMLKSWGINYEPATFTKAGLEEYIIFWKKYYAS